MKNIFPRCLTAALTFFVFSQAASALPFPIGIESRQSSAAVSVSGVSLHISDIKDIENGEVVAIRIVVENDSSKVLSTGIEDFSLGGVPSTANSIQLFLQEKDRNNRIINLIPYMGTVDSFVSGPSVDTLQDIVGDSYRGGLILPSASKSGYVFFRKVTDINDFRMYTVYKGNLFMLRIPVLIKTPSAKK